MKELPEIKTEKTAVKESILMWHWLWMNPTETKYDYFNFMKYNYTYPWEAGCACCEYYCSGFLNGCAECCIGKECEINYGKWDDNIQRKKNAKVILDALVKKWKKKNWKNKKIDEIII